MLTNLQKTFMMGSLALLAGGGGLMVYDRYTRQPNHSTLRSDYKTPAFNARESESMVQVREAEEYLRQNSPESTRMAMEKFNQVLAKNVSKRINDLSRFGLGVSLERLNEKNAALEHYRNLKKNGTRDPELSDRIDYRLGKLLLESNREEEGKALLEKTLASTTDNHLKSDIHTVFGNYYLKQKDRKRARENYILALRYNPDNLDAEIHKGEISHKVPKFQAGMEYRDEYLIGAEKRAPSLQGNGKVQSMREQNYKKGIAAFKAKRYEDALGHFRKVIGAYPDSDLTEKALYWSGESYEWLKKYSPAARMYSRTLHNDNRLMDQPAMIKRGILYYQKGNLGKAMDAFQQAEEDFPDGKYTPRAIEWRKETEIQMRDRELLKKYSRDESSDELDEDEDFDTETGDPSSESSLNLWRRFAEPE